MPELTPTDAEREVKELIKEIRTAILGPLLNLDFRRIKKIPMDMALKNVE